jgi:CBS-domain-containing membrane protein
VSTQLPTDRELFAEGREGSIRETALARALAIVAAGVSSGLAIFALTSVQTWTTLSALVPSFGASCALIFACPESPFAQPRNVIGGHLVSSGIGFLVLQTLGTGPTALATGVGLAIAGMMASKTMHPPAGGDPLIVIFAAASLSFLIVPILLGSVLLVLMGAAFHAARGRAYPTTARC